MRYEESILALIEASRDHLTAEQVFLKLKERYPAVVMATVYNNLNRLYSQGKIIKLSIDGGPDHYDNARVRHDHLVCVRCGHIEDVTLEDLKRHLEEETGVELLGYDLKLRYLCPACRAKEATS